MSNNVSSIYKVWYLIQSVEQRIVPSHRYRIQLLDIRSNRTAIRSTSDYARLRLGHRFKSRSRLNTLLYGKNRKNNN